MNHFLVLPLSNFSFVFVTFAFFFATTFAGAQGNPNSGGGSTTPAINCGGFARPAGLAPMDAAGLQRALDCANLGETISLSPTGAYTGPFTLRRIDRASGVITVRSNRADVFPDGSATRVDPALVGTAMPVLSAGAGTGPVLKTDPGAHHYTFVGIAFRTDHWVTPLVQLGSATQSAAALPHHMVFDRCHFAGDEATGSKRGLEANAGRGTSAADPEVVVKNSYFEDFKDSANDAQAIAAWNGYGPFLIENNYLEASGENVTFGGGDPSISGLIPANIVIRRNHFFKPAAWRTSATKWAGKNLFELKNARGVLVEGNVFENNWIGAQHTTGPQQGFAILFTPRNQSGGCTWCAVEQVSFRNNVVRDSPAGFNLLGSDDSRRSGALKNVEIRNNLLLNINPENNPGDASSYSQPGRLLQIRNAGRTRENVLENLIFENNTSFHSRLSGHSGEVSFSAGSAGRGLSFRNNVLRHNTCTAPYNNNCGISGESQSPGNGAIQTYFAASSTLGVTVSGNVLFAGNQLGQYQYPSSNEFPATAMFQSMNIDQETGLPISTDPVDYDFASNATGVRPGVAWNDAAGGLKDSIQGVVQKCSEACQPIF